MAEGHKGFSLFKKKEPEKKSEMVPRVTNSVNALEGRLKILEGRYNDLNRKVQLIDKNALSERTRFTKELKIMSGDILDIKRDINEISNKIDRVISELQTCARKEEVQTLKKYIDLWEPLNFATKKEVESMIDEKIK